MYRLIIIPILVILNSCAASDPYSGTIEITTNRPGYLIEVNDNVIGTSPCTIPRPRPRYYGSGVKTYQGFIVQAIPSEDIKKYAAGIGGVAMKSVKHVQDASAVSRIHIDTWFADPAKLEQSNRNTLHIYHH